MSPPPGSLPWCSWARSSPLFPLSPGPTSIPAFNSKNGTQPLTVLSPWKWAQRSCVHLHPSASPSPTHGRCWKSGELENSSLCSACNELQFKFSALVGHGWEGVFKAQVFAAWLCPRPLFCSWFRKKPVQPRLLLWSSRPVPCSAPSIIWSVSVAQLILLVRASGLAQGSDASRSSKAVLREMKFLTSSPFIGKGGRQTSRWYWRKQPKVYGKIKAFYDTQLRINLVSMKPNFSPLSQGHFVAFLRLNLDTFC